MKKLILILTSLSTLAGKSQTQYAWSDYIDNSVVLFYFDPYYNEFHSCRIKDSTYFQLFTDSVYLKSTSFSSQDIESFKLSVVHTGRDTISTVFGTYSYNLNHGLPFKPSYIFIEPRSADAAADYWLSEITSTYFTITFKDTPPTDIRNAIFDWVAYK